jgi:hypothetical protein
MLRSEYIRHERPIVDNRGPDFSESQQQEIHALRQARNRDRILLAGVMMLNRSLQDEIEILRETNDRVLREVSESYRQNV